MAWFLFIDESGQDGTRSPYEVLAGVAVRDVNLWPLIMDLHDAEEQRFGRRYSAGSRELKGRKILKKKVFRHTELNCQILPNEVADLAREALNDGASANVRHFKALAIAKLAYADDVFRICARYGCKLFASVVNADAPDTSLDGLRKDYAYLFQRFFYFLRDQGDAGEQGLILFDEMEKSKSHILLDQAHRYFKETAVGRARASLVIPEPFFVHSDLTTGIQLADLAAYCIAWGFRTNSMRAPVRKEINERYYQCIADLRIRTEIDYQGNPNYVMWGITHITDLRTRREQLELGET
jgi:predicted DCC family thiol-disulfide oxidoreductase YuxK